MEKQKQIKHLAVAHLLKIWQLGIGEIYTEIRLTQLEQNFAQHHICSTRLDTGRLRSSLSVEKFTLSGSIQLRTGNPVWPWRGLPLLCSQSWSHYSVRLWNRLPWKGWRSPPLPPVSAILDHGAKDGLPVQRQSTQRGPGTVGHQWSGQKNVSISQNSVKDCLERRQHTQLCQRF